MKKLLKDFIPPILIKLLKPKRKEAPSTYQIGEDLVDLPPGHTLPIYQGKHKLFDRFLPVLASVVPKGRDIIDIGANVGDTAIMMKQTSENRIICVEPSDKFFPYLEKNTSRIRNAKDQFVLHKLLIGSNEYSGVLEHYGGTAKVVINAESIGNDKVSMDELLSNSVIGLVKVDTDGFDFDVLNSGLSVIEKNKPLLFWENQIENEFQEEGYKTLYENLLNLGYNRLYIFDNFGNILLEESNYKALKEINDYTISIDKYACTRTFFFTDILAVSKENYDLAEKAIDIYKREWVRKSRN